MKKLKSSKNKYLSDSEIERFCRSVEDTLTRIRHRSGSKKNKKTKEDDLLSLEKDTLTFTS